ncbi:All-trans-phytoene synthase [Roseimaritima multifibrata]|uniref:All-trans-phytoene synthase n=1 Tax=Roseimaritima multifibrata TaxID=1930274 RepID=A0A517MMP0_9BACT|nr:phytoene/squalene synthase family protein [Roseimaritima multifibrata]QDS96141.1 All-trans-phytoene synthase [Roseimaritima multifibrata]
MNATVSVRDSYRYATKIAKGASSNFYRSFWLLPRRKRSAMHALYAFARITDDLGDCSARPDTRRQWLNWWRKTTELALQQDHSTGSIPMPEEPPIDGAPTTFQPRLRHHASHLLPALADTAQRFSIPSQHLLEIIDGVLADQQKTRFDTFEQLEHYCYLVASAVGLCCLSIWEFKEPLPKSAAIDCGVAFQLTNILRDIREDAGRGRIYLPRQHWERHGLCEDDLLDIRGDDRLRCLVIEESERAAKLFQSGWEVWDHIHPDGQAMFSMMWRTYRRLLSRIEEDPGSVANRRVRLSTSDRFELMAHHFVPPLFKRLPVPPWNQIATESQGE